MPLRSLWSRRPLWDQPSKVYGEPRQAAQAPLTVQAAADMVAAVEARVAPAAEPARARPQPAAAKPAETPPPAAGAKP